MTSGGFGQASGHMIYIQYQGIIKHTLMALSGAGTQADIDIVQDLYQEDWWLSALLARDPYHAIWHRQFFSHNYEITAYEAYLDMYVLTGNTTYLNAMLNAWSLLRQWWIMPGGSITLNEGDYYPPGSYYIGNVGTHIAATHGHGHGHGHGHSHAHAHGSVASASGDPYFHAPCMFQPGVAAPETKDAPESKADRTLAQKDEEKAAQPSSESDPPTGGTLPTRSTRTRGQPHLTAPRMHPRESELCGSVFWTLFNQRFHRLFPENESFAFEMERSVVNVGLAALGYPGSGGQGPNGTGIRCVCGGYGAHQ